MWIKLIIAVIQISKFYLYGLLNYWRITYTSLDLLHSIVLIYSRTLIYTMLVTKAILRSSENIVTYTVDAYVDLWYSKGFTTVIQISICPLHHRPHERHSLLQREKHFLYVI